MTGCFLPHAALNTVDSSEGFTGSVSRSLGLLACHKALATYRELGIESYAARALALAKEVSATA